jgi:hypothetical protein
VDVLPGEISGMIPLSAIIALGVALGMVAASAVFSALRANPSDNDPLILTPDEMLDPEAVDLWWRKRMAGAVLNPCHDWEDASVGQ